MPKGRAEPYGGGRLGVVRGARDSPPSWATWQRVTNCRQIPDRRTVVEAPEPIPVLARIVWGEDGEEFVPGWAIRWTRDLVLVEVRDPRSSTIGPWLDACDVQSRP